MKQKTNTVQLRIKLPLKNQNELQTSDSERPCRKPHGVSTLFMMYSTPSSIRHALRQVPVAAVISRNEIVNVND